MESNLANYPRRILAEGKFIRAVARRNWEWVERTNARAAVVIAAVTTQRQLVLVEQFRIPVEAPVIELPAGLVGDERGMEQEELLTAARRELLEETGFAADRWEYLVDGPASSGLASEVYTLYLAAGATQVDRGGGHGDEQIVVHAVPLDELEAWLAEKRRGGTLLDPKIFAALWFITRRL